MPLSYESIFGKMCGRCFGSRVCEITMTRKLNIKVYLETTVISYLAARPATRDYIKWAKQHLTAMWWERVFGRVHPYISVFVTEEMEQGDRSAAKKRLQLSHGIPVLADAPAIQTLATAFLKKINIPDRARLDAFHIACASVHQMDYLLTWNCTHIANAALRGVIESINEKHGYQTPVICTPEELLEI